LNKNREDYEEEFRRCRAAMGLPPEDIEPARSAAPSEPEMAAGLIEDPPVQWGRKQTILNLVVFCEDDGETIQQGCRFHLAPCEDGRWFVWAEVHQPPESPEPCDAFYDFYDGIGKAFATRAEALAAIYDYGAEFCAEEAEDLESDGNREIWGDPVRAGS
jgi:hypothetical protein